MAPDISAHSASQLLRKLREWKQENIGKARNLRIWQALGSTSLTLSEKRKLVRRKPIPKALREILGAEPTNESVEQLERDLQSRATTQLVEPQGQIAKSQAETPPSDQQPS